MELTSADTLFNITTESNIIMNLDNDPFGEDFPDASPQQFLNCNNFATISIIVRYILCILFMCANIFLATVILKFPSLQTRTNKYIFHMCILYTSFYLLPILYAIIRMFISWKTDGATLFVTLDSALCLYITVAFLLSVDWFVFALVPHLEDEYDKYFNNVLVGIYIVFMIEWIYSIAFHENYHRNVTRPLRFALLYLLYILLLTVMNIMKKRMSVDFMPEDREYAFTVSNITLFSFLPTLIFHIVDELLHHLDLKFYLYLCYIEPFPSVVAMGHPALVLYTLYKKDKRFKMAFDKMFKKSMRNYRGADLDASLDDDSENMQTNRNRVV
ncbi:unnamed protein product [Acanthoscelides obtectus]|uniref:Uncharacterized protein n=1 Tax=Acanthoscelides obtectus TaxID=200917 RepID=A0A9P0K929_ACAOB|nr:unnamed protein product [Acanthoscelides obtectus]CAK1646720.1 hypothetical protein AOBTE_LOCUS14839 [Acanthoscelides obtectus]